MNMGRKEYRFLWIIENYSYCCHDNGKELVSPKFTPTGMGGTAWSLWLYPRGCDDEDRDCISLFLTRSENDRGPEHFYLKYEIAILAADGSVLYCEKTVCEFQSGSRYGWGKFLKFEEIHSRRKADCLSRDTLTVRCKIWKGEGTAKLVNQVCVRTRIRIEHVFFLQKVEGFSELKANLRNNAQIRFSSHPKWVTLSSLYVTDHPSKEGEIIIEITACDANKILSKCKLFLLDHSGNLIECGKADNRFEIESKKIQMLPLSVTKKVILSKKSQCLPNDTLSVLCQCTFSAGLEYEKIERVLHDIPVTAIENIETKAFWDEVDQTPPMYPCALDDFKDLYLSHILADVELKTKTKSFPAHRSVLGARSSVFRAMLSHDMEEKNTGCILLDDLENDTVQQLLLFLYSDVVQDLQWKTAYQLYYAADKYEVRKLKAMCTMFLLKNLDISNAVELLLLADTHNDSDLKKTVQNFIWKHEYQVYGSEDWEMLMKSNPDLFMETMYMKYKRVTRIE